MKWLDYVNAAASCATAIGVFVAGWQIKLSQRQARTQFEDDLTKQYREIIRGIPVEALLGEALTSQQRKATLDDFYRYIDLSNEQIFLRQNGRVSKETWKNWREGIESYLDRPAFKTAWREIKVRAKNDFDELKRLEKSGFSDDPYDWEKRGIFRLFSRR